MTRRDKIAVWADAIGLSRVLSKVPQSDCLLVVNYRRIGDATATDYDPGAFSATAEELREQLQYLSSHVYVARIEEAVDFAIGRAPWKGAAALVTFDDGYVDNYRIAFPALRAQAVQGVFFLPSSLIGTNYMPAWDRIAYMVRHTAKAAIELEYPGPARFELAPGQEPVIIQALTRVCQSAGADSGRFLQELERATGVNGNGRERLLLNWAEVREMLEGGMAIGSHAHRHEPLDALPVDEQFQELSRSRTVLEEHLKTTVDTLSYPVGSRTSFSNGTLAALARAGYRAAFSLYGGVNLAGRTEPYNIRRVAADVVRRHRLVRAQWGLGPAQERV